MSIDSMQRIPIWAMSLIVAICGTLLVMFVNDIRRDARDVRIEVQVVRIMVTQHSVVLDSYKGDLSDIKTRIERLEKR